VLLTQQAQRPQTDIAMLTRPLGEQECDTAAKVFKALSDPVRLRLLSVIAARGRTEPLCVCDLSAGFTVSAPTISHHLAVLRAAGLVCCQRQGTFVYYWPDMQALQDIASLLTPETLD
jgi:ArsR family transcriptional regulator, arsenate/arsenite/antimonite-responsive transcriptional repressor